MNRSPCPRYLCYAAGCLFVLGPSCASASEPVRMREELQAGARYQVQIRVQLQGALTLPAQKGKPEGKPLAMNGESSIDYDERVLSAERDGRVNKTVRIFRRIDF